MARRLCNRLTPETAKLDPKSVKRLKYKEFATKYFPHYFPGPWSLMHEDFGERLTDWHTRRGRREWFIAPRDGSKTTHWSKIYPIFCAAYELEMFMILAGHIATQPQRNLEAIRTELETNYALARDFPHLCGTGRVWNASEIVTRNGIRILTAARGKAIRGATSGQYRPSLMIFDDLDDEDSINTTEARDAAWKWLTSTAIPLGQAKHVNVCVIDTLKHEDDVISKCGKTPGWFGKRYKSIIDWPVNRGLWTEWAAVYRQMTIDRNSGKIKETDDPALAFYLKRQKAMDKGAKVLWPYRESPYDLMVYIQQNGEKSFATEKQGETKAAAGTEWPAECFDESVILFTDWPTDRSEFAMACDPSKGKGRNSDPSAWVWGCRGEDGLIYVDADIRRRDAMDICKDGIKIALAFKPRAIGVEADSYGAIVELWGMVAEKLNCQHELPPVLTIHSADEKIRRIRNSLTKMLRNYRFRFRANSVGVGILLAQLKGFPLPGEHDDGPDALEMFLRLLLTLLSGGLNQDSGQERANV